MRETSFDLDQYVFSANGWQTPATHYPELSVGDFRIHHSYYSARSYYPMWGVKDYLYFTSAKRIPLAMLQERRGSRWHTWMVDDPPHWYSMEVYAQAAKGRVLVAGLGLGLVCHCLTANPGVTAIDVIERSEDVIKLVKPLIPQDERISIQQDDFYNWVEKKNRYDMIIVDLWTSSGKQQKADMYYREVLPLYARLEWLYPAARKVFHGFVTLCDPCPISEEMMLLIREVKPYG